MDDLAPDRLRERITGSWGSSLTVLESTASTMDDATRAAQADAADGHVIVADAQTQGRGAHGRLWDSPPGSDLYFSIVSRPSVDPSSMALITLAVGLGVRDAVAALVPDRPIRVKWPNDVWIDGKKCAGILVESRMIGSRIEAVIVGVGLNVNRTDWTPELEPISTSVRSERSDPAPLDRGDVLAAVLASAERRVTSLARDGAAALVNALRPHLALVGERVRWEEGQGVFEGIDAQGAAVVRVGGVAKSLHAARLERVRASS